MFDVFDPMPIWWLVQPMFADIFWKEKKWKKSLKNIPKKTTPTTTQINEYTESGKD